jgi:hypothetical protein
MRFMGFPRRKTPQGKRDGAAAGAAAFSTAMPVGTLRGVTAGRRESDRLQPVAGERQEHFQGLGHRARAGA